MPCEVDLNMFVAVDSSYCFFFPGESSFWFTDPDRPISFIFTFRLQSSSKDVG